MGWNSGYTVYEETVISIYDSCYNLTPNTLKAVLAAYQGTDIDHGGCRDLKSKDGLTADEIVIKTFRPKFWSEYKNHRVNDDSAEFWEWNERRWEEWYEIVVNGNYEIDTDKQPIDEYLGFWNTLIQKLEQHYGLVVTGFNPAIVAELDGVIVTIPLILAKRMVEVAER